MKLKKDLVKIKKFYDSNTDFKCYVDKYMTTRHIPQDKLEEVLQHVIVRDYAEYIEETSREVTHDDNT